jgi:hypothetical protein
VAHIKKENNYQDNKFFAEDGSMETFKADPITAEDLKELAILREMLYFQGKQAKREKKKEKKQG